MNRYLLVLLNNPRNKYLVEKLIQLDYTFDTIYYQNIKSTKIEFSIYDGIIIGGDWKYSLTNLGETLKDKYLLELYKLYSHFTNKIVIGICFGCQLLAVFNHCIIDLSPEKYILKMDNIILDKRYKLFTGLSKIESFCRSHERMIKTPSININILAKTKDDIIMIISIKNKKHYGILFHPEFSNNGNILFHNIKYL